MCAVNALFYPLPGIQLDETDPEIVEACAFMESMDALVAVGSKQAYGCSVTCHIRRA